jgi:polyisoprenoid-binding protein YceI
MKKLFLLVLSTVSLFSSEFIVNKDSSYIKFEVSKMFFIGVTGEFREFSGSIELNSNGKLSQINGLVSISSIDTDDKKRDKHLQADDYFHIVKFPNIVFKSNKIYNNSLKATISIKGVEKEVSFQLDEFESSKNRVSFELSSTMNRQDFMLNGSMSSLISDDVYITAKITGVKAD